MTKLVTPLASLDQDVMFGKATRQLILPNSMIMRYSSGRNYTIENKQDLFEFRDDFDGVRSNRSRQFHVFINVLFSDIKWTNINNGAEYCSF